MSSKVIVVDKEFKEKSAFTSLDSFESKKLLLAQVVKAEMANLRSGTAHTKNRGEVRGGGKKPWKQKGTGRARHGSRRSPIWVGGGITFGPRNTKNYHQKINKSARLSALKSILKYRLEDKKVFLLEKLDFIKTKSATEVLTQIAQKAEVKNNKIGLVYIPQEKDTVRGFSNTGIKLIPAVNLKIINLVDSQAIVLSEGALNQLEERIKN